MSCLYVILINIYKYLYVCLSVCMFVCLFVCWFVYFFLISTKTAKSIKPNIFVATFITQGKVYVWSKFSIYKFFSLWNFTNQKKYAIIYMYFFKEKTWQFKKHLKRKISQERGAQRPDSMNSEKKLKWVDLVEPLL